MGGSEGESRVSAVGSDAFPMLSPELAKRSSRKKMQSLINTNGPHSDAKWLLDQDRRTSEIQIEHQTQTVAG
jgi:hypothetical protein